MDVAVQLAVLPIGEIGHGGTMSPEDITAAAHGDASAFERIVVAHQSLVCSIAFAISRDIEASEEIAQETFVAAWRNLKKLRSATAFGAWLRQLTRNHANDYLRKRVRERQFLT